MSEVVTLPNEGLFITRKRKKWKFAHFDLYPNCFSFERGEDPKKIKVELQKYFKRSQPVVLEVAAGNAQFSFELAKLHPDQNFIAIDIKSDRLYTSAKRALVEEVENIAFLRMPLTELTKVFTENSVYTIWLTFPDPHPKKRSAKHRLTHEYFLRQYSIILNMKGSLKFKTDNRKLFLWSLEQLVARNWHLFELSFDLHETSLSNEYKIKTYYEEKFTKQGIPTNYLAATCSKESNQ